MLVPLILVLLLIALAGGIFVHPALFAIILVAVVLAYDRRGTY